MTLRLGPAFRSRRLIAILAVFLICIGVAHAARAANPSCTGGSVSISMPDVTVTHDTPVGSLLGAAQPGTATFNCKNIPTSRSENPLDRASIQVFNLTPSLLVGQPPSSSDANINSLIFSTNIPGIGIQLTMNPAMSGYDQNPGDQQTNAYVVGSISAPSGTLAVNYTAQFIVTGTVTPGTLTSKALLPNFEWYIYGCGCNASTSASLGTNLTINGGATVSLQGCTVNSDSTGLTVTLPTMASNAFPGAGFGAGMTPFNINLSCQTGTTVFITMSTSNANATYTGVINPTTGTNFAKNIGVQLLYAGTNANGYVTPTAVTFGSAQNLGASPGGTMSVQYYAQYFDTGTPVTAGNVSATATFTMTYQ